MHTRRVAVLILAVCAGPAAAQNDSCTPYPEAFAQGFYRSDYAFFNEPPEQLRKLVAPELLELLQRERRCAERHGGCRLHLDPWLGGTDGSIGYPQQFHRESQEASAAVVAMSYPLTTTGAQPARTNTVRLTLRKAPASGCWQVQDFVTPTGESLLQMLGPPGQP
ncbi:MAG: hypothetical protein P4L83_07395 [Nevskia sp.]|nr:hypothetical protein [Nevskia sp.]